MCKLVAVIALLAALLGCKQSSTEPAPNAVLSIDLQQAFDNDSVLVALDNSQIFAGRITTNYVWSLAHRISPIVTSGSHRITVHVVGVGAQADTTFQLTDTLTVAVQYSRSAAQLSFVFYRGLILYD